MPNQDPVIFINNDKCKNSYSCVRICPVKAIEIAPGMEHPRILTDRCIGCGLCFIACAPGAIEYRDSTLPVTSILESDHKTVALANR